MPIEDGWEAVSVYEHLATFGEPPTYPWKSRSQAAHQATAEPRRGKQRAFRPADSSRLQEAFAARRPPRRRQGVRGICIPPPGQLRKLRHNKSDGWA